VIHVEGRASVPETSRQLLSNLIYASLFVCPSFRLHPICPWKIQTKRVVSLKRVRIVSKGTNEILDWGH